MLSTKLPAPKIKLRQKASSRNFYYDLPVLIRRNILLYLLIDRDQLIEVIKNDPSLFNEQNGFYLKEFCTAIDGEFSKTCVPQNFSVSREIEKVQSTNPVSEILIQMIQSPSYGIVCRQIHLTRALSEVGLQQRSDSKLCTDWVAGKLESSWNLTRVVDMCCEMKWLYDHTNYRRNLRRALDRARDEMYDSCDSDDEYHEFDFNSIEAMVRAEVLKVKPIPAKFPWLKRKRIDSSF